LIIGLEPAGINQPNRTGDTVISRGVNVIPMKIAITRLENKAAGDRALCASYGL